MITIEIIKHIKAPLEMVFLGVSNVRNFASMLPHVVNVEFLTDRQSGAGTRFRETRVIDGAEYTNELEITEYVENQHVRIVTSSHGTVWDSFFTVAETDRITTLDLNLTGKTRQLLPMFINPLARTTIRNAIDRDLEMVKKALENR